LFRRPVADSRNFSFDHELGHGIDLASNLAFCF
jgi:hypothetical protein